MDCPQRREWLDADELSRLDRYKVEAAQRRFLQSHSLLRAVLTRHVPTVGEQQWGFVHGPHGRPELDRDSQIRVQACWGGFSRLRFNLSHADGLMAVIVTADQDCGIDVESTTRSTDMGRVARRSFTVTELSAFECLAHGQQRRRFFEIWTLKESYIKAIGTGLATPLRHFGFDTDVDPPSIIFSPQLDDDPRHWQLGLRRPTESTQLAWALRLGPGNMSSLPTLRWF